MRWWVAAVLCGCGRIDFDLADGPPKACVLQFAPPINLGLANTTADDYQPTLGPDGLEVFFTQGRPGGSDTFVASRPDRISPFGAPEWVIGIQAPFFDDNPELSRDGLAIYFDSDRMAAYQYRLYVATRAALGGPFSSPSLVPGLETVLARAPALSASGDELFFQTDTIGEPIRRAVLIGGSFQVVGTQPDLGAARCSTVAKSRVGRPDDLRSSRRQRQP